MIASSGYRGEVRYLRRSSGEQRGWERFLTSQSMDGTRVVRAVSSIDDVRGGVLRDVTLTVDPTWRPLECYTRLEAGGIPEGSLLAQVAGRELLATSRGMSGPPTTHRLQVPERFALISHPVVLDAWQFPAAYDHDRGGEQRWTAYDVSPGHEGYDLDAGALHGNGGVDLGEEEVRVEAGTFLCRRYRILSEQFDPIDVWVTGPHLLLVLMDWAGFDARYELSELTAW